MPGIRMQGPHKMAIFATLPGHNSVYFRLFDLNLTLPDVAAHFHVGAAAAAPRASRAGLPLCGSGPDNVWQT